MLQWIIGGIVICLIVFFIVLKIRSDNEGDGLLESAKKRVKSIGDCCKKIGQFFGGGA